MKNIWAFLFGGLFSLGLMISGMSNPEKVLGFLDIFGDWDASLAFVMMGAIAVAFIPFQKAVRQAEPKTVYHEAIELPRQNQLDSKLIIGSALFGIGWGIAGICPAPSFTLIGLGYYQALYFIAAMMYGMYLHHRLLGKKS
ncbi:DUF6691 family protein [Acinetobacter indicus]|jgi:uncharacterized membrane protein YedE/YeeE|uniref:Uncharacterized protein n=2 Tax=Acinetobacter indicus TaxID=756892 RepID=V2UMV0_9GAMM|nr:MULTISPECIES: DUF6691 family protein [Acinetobacter]ENW90879.1 hypothetical protein F905_00907 [Acinetobacter sp. CIP 53.82]EPF75239.1 hypothetical protein F956_00139 [Acinetobacter indicus ANC 4215]ESK49931.1 hypothetical protein P253_00788 [Acinetobacter indicus CIP 110367]MBA0156310.1 YeeE/YedE family protein [Acinetobacter indicus]MCO8107717.1 YeeE/YedE family protein [Acinetobacter indicus]